MGKAGVEEPLLILQLLPGELDFVFNDVPNVDKAFFRRHSQDSQRFFSAAGFNALAHAPVLHKSCSTRDAISPAASWHTQPQSEQRDRRIVVALLFVPSLVVDGGSAASLL